MDKQRTPAELWQAIAGEVQLKIPRPAFETWFRGVTAKSFDGHTLRLKAPNQHIADALSTTYMRFIEWEAGHLNVETVEVFSLTKPKPAEVTPVEPKERTFGDLKRFELIRWLSAWGFSWSHRLLRDYDQNLIVELLDSMIGSPDSDEANRVKPAWFVDELKVVAEERQHTVNAESHVAEIVPFDRWHKSA